MASPRHDGHASGPVLRVPGARLKAGGPEPKQGVAAATGALLATRRAASLGPEEAAGPASGHPVRVGAIHAVLRLTRPLEPIPEGPTAGVIPTARHPAGGPFGRGAEASVLGAIVGPLAPAPVRAPPTAVPVLPVVTTAVLTVAAVGPPAVSTPRAAASIPSIATAVRARRKPGAAARGRAAPNGALIAVVVGRLGPPLRKAAQLPRELTRPLAGAVTAPEAPAKPLEGQAAADDFRGRSKRKALRSANKGHPRPAKSRSRVAKLKGSKSKV